MSEPAVIWTEYEGIYTAVAHGCMLEVRPVERGDWMASVAPTPTAWVGGRTVGGATTLDEAKAWAESRAAWYVDLGIRAEAEHRDRCDLAALRAERDALRSVLRKLAGCYASASQYAVFGSGGAGLALSHVADIAAKALDGVREPVPAKPAYPKTIERGYTGGDCMDCGRELGTGHTERCMYHIPGTKARDD